MKVVTDFANWPPELRPKRGKFEMAFLERFDPVTRTSISSYRDARCWLVGEIAITRDSDRPFAWRCHHAATGFALPCAYGRNLKEAATVARALNDAIDWKTITRGKTPADIQGQTEDKANMLKATIYSFAFLRPFCDALHGKPA